jgi:1-acyl-sn-glycerol-3-phosphate acyltransferase
MRFISKMILRLFGWKVIGGIPADVPKCVVSVAPHTSMWDFVIGRLAFWELGLKARFLIKKELFFWPLGPVIKWLGGIPVDRQKKGNLVEQVADMFNNYDSLYITVTPEGTRKLVNEWKRGYYYISLKAKVPIALGFLDYRKKIGGVVNIFYPSGNYDEDRKIVEAAYRGLGARHPEKYNLSV